MYGEYVDTYVTIKNYILFTGSDICMAWNPICLGKVHGVIGKMKIHPGMPLMMPFS